ncbi:MAG: hypothetical protein ACMG6E_01450 [Candidatus Roizmanbacteria bacterium]
MKPPSEHLREQTNKQTGEKEVYTDKDFQENDAGFQIQWGRLRMILNRVLYDLPNVRDMDWMNPFEDSVYKANNLSPDFFLFQIVSHMIDSDLNYQTEPRQGRKEDSDAYASHIQMYIFGDVPAQSPEYVQLYKDLRRLLAKQGVVSDFDISEDHHYVDEDVSLKSRFEKLVKEWEENHPGKKFIPDEE